MMPPLVDFRDILDVSRGYLLAYLVFRFGRNVRFEQTSKGDRNPVRAVLNPREFVNRRPAPQNHMALGSVPRGLPGWGGAVS
jgi:hypothetical protein